MRIRRAINNLNSAFAKQKGNTDNLFNSFTSYSQRLLRNQNAWGWPKLQTKFQLLGDGLNLACSMTYQVQKNTIKTQPSEKEERKKDNN